MSGTLGLNYYAIGIGKYYLTREGHHVSEWSKSDVLSDMPDADWRAAARFLACLSL